MHHTPNHPWPPAAPGRLKDWEAERLRELARGNTVLQIGAYCGRGTVALAATATQVIVLDDWTAYPGGREAVAAECGKNVKGAGCDDKVDLCWGDSADLSLADALPACDLVYVDADRDPGSIAADLAFARLVLRGDSRIAFHESGCLVVWEVSAGHLTEVLA